ncbi:MAG: myo-inosose-2 dehydratase [Francisella sp.]
MKYEFANVRLGIAPINWTNDDDPSLGGDVSFAQCVDEMSQAGFVGTEIGNKYPADPQELLSELKKRNLVVSSRWFSTFFTVEGKYEQTLKDFMDCLSFMKAVGGDVINLCECGFCIQQSSYPLFSDKKPKFTAKQWQLLIKGLHDLGRLAYDYDIKVSYHFHLGTGVQNEDEIEYLMDHTSPELLGLLLDTGHAYAAGVSIENLLIKYGKRINQVHLKDVRANVLQEVHNNNLTFMDGVRNGMFTVPGDGDVNFDLVFENLSKLNYQGWMIVEAEQDPAKANPLEYAKKAYNFINSKIVVK